MHVLVLVCTLMFVHVLVLVCTLMFAFVCVLAFLPAHVSIVLQNIIYITFMHRHLHAPRASKR